MPFHKIDTDTAAELITAFLTHDDLYDIAVNHAIGGLIDLDMLTGSVDGWAFWFCRNSSDNNFPSFFIAYEPNTWDDDSPGNVIVESDSLHRPYDNYIFTYPSEAEVSFEAVVEFISEPVKEWDDEKEPDEIIEKTHVERFATEFLEDLTGNDDPNTYNDYPFSYFVHSEVEEFVQQGSYVRYYFGYDESASPNLIRLILVSVDNDGSNQLSPEYFMFENGWPPEAN